VPAMSQPYSYRLSFGIHVGNCDAS
jgi:hypothetical protein